MLPTISGFYHSMIQQWLLQQENENITGTCSAAFGGVSAVAASSDASTAPSGVVGGLCIGNHPRCSPANPPEMDNAGVSRNEDWNVWHQEPFRCAQAFMAYTCLNCGMEHQRKEENRQSEIGRFQRRNMLKRQSNRKSTWNVSSRQISCMGILERWNPTALQYTL